MTDDPNREMTAADVAAECRVNADTARDWMRRGIMLNGQHVQLTASRSVGKRYRTTARELAEFRAICQRIRGMVAVAEMPTAAQDARRRQESKQRALEMLSR